MDTPFGKLSFAEIQGHEKKDEILAGLKPSKQARYNEWEEQTANQTEKAIDTRIQTANQTEKAIDTRIQTANQTEKAVKTEVESKEVISKRLTELNAKLSASI